MQASVDTIVARATPPGRGGVGIVRISGPKALAIALKLTQKQNLKPRYAHFGSFYHQSKIIDSGLVLSFPGPNSFTGEDVVELQGHGGPVVIDQVIRATLELGARMATPGEFSQRAFLNGKIDLAQAEAIADLIDATTTQAAYAAKQSLSGEFSKQVKCMDALVIELRMYVEAAIDFVEEEIDFLSSNQVSDRFTKIQRHFYDLIKATKQGVSLQEGKKICIVGAPNAGKSSLLNLWAKEEASIVTDVPGTTRDMVIREVSLDGVALHLLDTAGLRETDNAIEREGIERAKDAIDKADWVICLQEVGHSVPDVVNLALKDYVEKTLHVYNKIDLNNHPAGIVDDKAYISAKTGEGFDEFLQWLKVKFNIEIAEGTYLARRRHLDALYRFEQHLENAKQFIATKTGELLAEELKLASHCLQEITGHFSSDDLLGKIFSSFCIGK